MCLLSLCVCARFMYVSYVIDIEKDTARLEVLGATVSDP